MKLGSLFGLKHSASWPTQNLKAGFQLRGGDVTPPVAPQCPCPYELRAPRQHAVMGGGAGGIEGPRSCMCLPLPAHCNARACSGEERGSPQPCEQLASTASAWEMSLREVPEKLYSWYCVTC